MRRFCKLFLFVLILMFMLPSLLDAQEPWSGIISPARAADWGQAGLPGDVPPDASWIQCGSTIAAYGSSSSPGSPSTIQTAINNCGKDQYVLLGPGDFYLSGNVYLKSDMVLRGSGANQTRVHIGSGTTNWGCNGPWGVVCVVGSNTYSSSSCSFDGLNSWSCPNGATPGGDVTSTDWTAGYSQGSTTITLNSVTGIVTNLTPIVLDQCDTGLTGSPGEESCDGGTAGGITATSVAAGGSGYDVGDTGTITCATDWNYCFGANDATYEVTSVSNGAVTGFTVTKGGNGYIYTALSTGAPAATTIATSGSGTGFTVDITGINNDYDNGGFFICDMTMICEDEGPGGTSRPGRSQEEVALATSITGSGPYTVTLNHPLTNPNWSSSQSPQAWWGSQTITNAGVEDLLMDPSAVASSCVVVQTATSVWVYRVACNAANFYHVDAYVVSNLLVRDSYFYWTKYAGTTSYGVGSSGAVGNSLFENNILQGIVDPLNPSGACAGCVFAYNFSVNDYDAATAFEFASSPMHAAATNYILEEGNIGAGANQDSIHGPHLADTYFRNYFTGDESNNGTLPTDDTIPVIIGAYSRFNNYLGNVLGTQGYHTSYECNPTSASTVKCPLSNWNYIWDIGWSHAPSMLDYNNNPAEPNDLRTITSTYRYGNYDVVSGAVQWNSSEVPASDPSLPNPVPSSNTFPASFYDGVTGAFPSCGTGLSFWKNPTTEACSPYPPIGPDVVGGDIGMCTSGPYKWSLALSSSQCAGGSFTQSVDDGYGNSNPAMRCYLNQMGGPPDGTGSMLSFNPYSCYAQDPASGSSRPSAPSGLTGTVSAQP